MVVNAFSHGGMYLVVAADAVRERRKKGSEPKAAASA
jgi:hypothetical protein